jgi:hypothetical protein
MTSQSRETCPACGGGDLVPRGGQFRCLAKDCGHRSRHASARAAPVGPGPLLPLDARNRFYGRLVRATPIPERRQAFQDYFLEEGVDRPAVVVAAPALGTTASLTARGWAVEEPFGETPSQALAGLPSASAAVVVLAHRLADDRDPAAAVGAAMRVLRPRGRLVIIEENCASLAHRLLRGRLLDPDVGPPQAFTPASLRRLLARSGFERVMVWTSSYGPGTPWLQARQAAIGGPSRAWSATMSALDPVWLASTYFDPMAGTEVLAWALKD